MRYSAAMVYWSCNELHEQREKEEKGGNLKEGMIERVRKDETKERATEGRK